MFKSIVKKLLFSLMSPEKINLLGEPFFWLIGKRGKGKLTSLTSINRVLIIQLDFIGDSVINTGFLRELHRNFPQAKITLIITFPILNLVEYCPYVDEILTYSPNVSRKYGELVPQMQKHSKALMFSLKYLWHKEIDLAIIPRWDYDMFHATFLSYFSGASWRIGYSENINEKKQKVNKGYDHLLTHILEDKSPKHEAERSLDIISFLGGNVIKKNLELWLTREDRDLAKEILQCANVQEDNLLIALGPGAGGRKRMWPIDRYIELGAWLKNKYNAYILVIGGPGEEKLGKKIEEELGALSCHPSSGSVLHYNSPKRWSPWGVENIVIQPEAISPECHDGCISKEAHCILDITVEQVQDAVEKLYPLKRNKKNYYGS